MKKISVVIPCYNEIENVEPISEAIIDVFNHSLVDYDYEILFIDNHSSDGTRELLQKLCMGNKKIKAIFNARNFGIILSPYYGILQSDGDCTIQMVADFQDPPSMIVDFVRKWEEGFKIVIAIKITSSENKLIYFLRSVYYKFLKKITDIEHIEHFTGFGLYDRDFVDLLRKLDDPYPYLRGIVAELGYSRAEIPFNQPRRERGITKNNWYTLYDMAMLGITSYSKVVMRMATILGFTISGLSILVAFIYFLLKLLLWNEFPMGIAPIIISIFFFGSVQLFFTGFLGEYILSINIRTLKRPLVVEEQRLNFDTDTHFNRKIIKARSTRYIVKS
jgi:glycosyltransferase involved in cell wall biosynthesis